MMQKILRCLTTFFCLFAGISPLIGCKFERVQFFDSLTNALKTVKLDLLEPVNQDVEEFKKNTINSIIWSLMNLPIQPNVILKLFWLEKNNAKIETFNQATGCEITCADLEKVNNLTLLIKIIIGYSSDIITLLPAHLTIIKPLENQAIVNSINNFDYNKFTLSTGIQLNSYFLINVLFFVGEDISQFNGKLKKFLINLCPFYNFINKAKFKTNTIEYLYNETQTILVQEDLMKPQILNLIINYDYDDISQQKVQIKINLNTF